jgi:hypothetical protein
MRFILNEMIMISNRLVARPCRTLKRVQQDLDGRAGHCIENIIGYTTPAFRVVRNISNNIVETHSIMEDRAVLIDSLQQFLSMTLLCNLRGGVFDHHQSSRSLLMHGSFG